jgi:hypothetical protein
MHFNFDFSAGQILWTLTFAGVLVLLVVLLGRDRARRFPWFTLSIVMMALRMMASRLLSERMPQITFSEIFLVLSDVASIIAILVVVEIARRAFQKAGRAGWIIWSVILLAVGGVITARWGPWPSWQTLTAGSTLSALRAMQLFAQKTDLLSDTLVIQLGLLVVLFGRRYGAGFRSHVQQIVIGLSTVSMAQLAVRLIWQEVALHTTIHAQADYERVMALEGKFYNANNVVYLAALLWWIACLWMDEPGGIVAAVPAGTPPEIAAQTNEPSSETNETSAQPSESLPETSETSTQTSSTDSERTPGNLTSDH